MDLTNLEKKLVIKNFHLEPITAKHADLLFQDLQAEELYKYIPQSPPKSLSDLRNKYLKWSQRRSPSGVEFWLNYAIYDANIKKYVGTVQATIQVDGHNYIAYEVFPKYQRRKVATNSVLRLIDFINVNFSRSLITAHVDSRNIKSYKFLESLGFKKKDFIKDADYFDGCTSDEFVYELQKPVFGD